MKLKKILTLSESGKIVPLSKPEKEELSILVYKYGSKGYQLFYEDYTFVREENKIEIVPGEYEKTPAVIVKKEKKDLIKAFLRKETERKIEEARKKKLKKAGIEPKK